MRKLLKYLVMAILVAFVRGSEDQLKVGVDGQRQLGPVCDFVCTPALLNRCCPVPKPDCYCCNGTNCTTSDPPPSPTPSRPPFVCLFVCLNGTSNECCPDPKPLCGCCPCNATVSPPVIC